MPFINTVFRQPTRKRTIAALSVPTLPSTIDPGDIVLFEHQFWRGLLPGESSLPAGHPWPAKGYKEYSAIWQILKPSPNTIAPNPVFTNEINLTLDFTRPPTRSLWSTVQDVPYRINETITLPDTSTSYTYSARLRGPVSDKLSLTVERYATDVEGAPIIASEFDPETISYFEFIIPIFIRAFPP